MSTPLLSIITVTYNAEKFLEPTIQSVGRQTLPGIEYVIVDGLSKDSTVDIIKRYPEIVTRYISEKDKGLYDAMNKAIALARGEYLLFLNAGDLLYSDTVLEDVFTQSGRPDLIYGDTEVIDTQYQTVGLRHLAPPEKLHWKSFQKGMVVCHQAILAKRSLTPNYDTHYRIAADIDWAIRLTQQCKSFYFYRKPLVKFMQDGISTQYRSEGLKERYRVMVNHYGKFSTLMNNLYLGARYFLSLRFIKNVRRS